MNATSLWTSNLIFIKNVLPHCIAKTTLFLFQDHVAWPHTQDSWALSLYLVLSQTEVLINYNDETSSLWKPGWNHRRGAAVLLWRAVDTKIYILFQDHPREAFGIFEELEQTTSMHFSFSGSDQESTEHHHITTRQTPLQMGVPIRTAPFTLHKTSGTKHWRFKRTGPQFEILGV